MNVYSIYHVCTHELYRYRLQGYFWVDVYFEKPILNKLQDSLVIQCLNNLRFVWQLCITPFWKDKLKGLITLVLKTKTKTKKRTFAKTVPKTKEAAPPKAKRKALKAKKIDSAGQPPHPHQELAAQEKQAEHYATIKFPWSLSQPWRRRKAGHGTLIFTGMSRPASARAHQLGNLRDSDVAKVSTLLSLD